MSKEIDLQQIAAEAEGISALACVLSSTFLEADKENPVTFSDETVGNCLFAIEWYAHRLSDDLLELEVKT